MTLTVVPEQAEWLQAEAGIADAAGFVNLANAELVDAMARAIESKACSGGGFLSPAHWLSVHAGVTTSHAHVVVTVALSITDFPHVMASFRAAKLSLHQAAAAMTASPAADRRVAEFAEFATVHQIHKFVRTVAPPPPPPADFDDDRDGDRVHDQPGDEQLAEPNADAALPNQDGPGSTAQSGSGLPDGSVDDGARRPQQHSRSSASVSFGFDQWCQFWLTATRLTADQGLIIEAALHEARDHLFRSGHPQVTWGEALVELCRRSLAAAGPERAERFKTYLHVEVPTSRSTTSSASCTSPSTSATMSPKEQGSPSAVTTHGIPIPPNIFDYLTCDSLVQVVWQQGHQPIGVGRTTRTVPNRLRRLIEQRDLGCRVPGCTNTLGLQVHHIVAWSQGGATEAHNLVLVCDAHHHQHHSGDITIAGNPNLPHGQPGSFSVTDQRGRPVRSHPSPRPPDSTQRPPNPNYRHPSGESCDFRYIAWKPPPAA